MKELNSVDLQHDHNLIEQSFKDFNKEKWITDNKMKVEFGKYGWGK